MTHSDLENGIPFSPTGCAPSAEALEIVPDKSGTSFASDEGSCFKENVNINTSETSKLSVEPLRMKRKKKGGGFNLRKSLAWDRAFFTEEGVLDPQELSVISGASCREGLPFVNEDTPGGLWLPIKPVDVPKLKNNILKELQDEDLTKDKKKDWSSTSHKVPIFVGCNSGSSCGDCPRPLPSSSLKRPANVNVGKVTGRELKLSKVPGLKPGLSPICATTKSTTHMVNHAKHKQITQPGLKSCSKSLKNTQNASKFSCLQPVLYSDGKRGNSSSERHTSISMRPEVIDKADNSSSKMISYHATPARPVHSSEGQDESRTFAVPLSQNAHISGRTMHPLQNQVMKPSGLRMPSPSLSFFSQSKPSVFRNLSFGGTETEVYRSQRPEKSKLQENWRTVEADNKSPHITSNKAISSRLCTAASHVNAVASIKPNLEQTPMQKIQDNLKKNRIKQISHEVAELQNIDIEVHSQSESQEQSTNDNSFEKAIDACPVKSELCERGWHNSEFRSEHKYSIHEPQTITAVDEPPKGENTCNLLFLNHGAIIGPHCEDSLDHRVQKSLALLSDWEDPCKSDCHEPYKENTDSIKYSLGESDKRTDKDKKRLKSNKETNEQLDVTQQNGSWCSRSANMEAVEPRLGKSENSCFGSNNLHAYLSKEAAVVGVLTDNLPVGQTHIQKTACNSHPVGYKDNANLISEFPDGSEHLGKDMVVQSICLEAEMESERYLELDTSERLPEKQTCLPKYLQEQDYEKLTFVFQDRKDGSGVTVTKMMGSLSQGEMYDSVDNSTSPERHNPVLNSTINCEGKCLGNTNFMSERGTHEVPQENALEKVAEMEPVIQDGSTSNPLTISVMGNESDMDGLRNVQDSGAELVQSPESNVSNECHFKKSGHLTFPNAELGAEDLEHGNEGLCFDNYLQTKNPAGEPYEHNKLASMEDSITGQNKIYLINSKSPSISAKESPSTHESCDDAYGTGVRSAIVDAMKDPPRVEPYSDTTKSEVSKDTNSAFNSLHPKLEPVKVQAALSTATKHGDGHIEKNRSFVLPQNAIPFSDEWLAAIEAAGEDVLTRKSGAVQNSPPDKSLPEPSPWSPVKKKNSQIGPFDCTKFTHNLS